MRSSAQTLLNWVKLATACIEGIDFTASEFEPLDDQHLEFTWWANKFQNLVLTGHCTPKATLRVPMPISVFAKVYQFSIRASHAC